MPNLHDQVVVITGASSGIGRAVALNAADHGATLVLLARNVQALRTVAAQAERRSGAHAYCFGLDVTDPVAIDSIYARIHDLVPRVDVLVNAAGFGVFEEALATPMAVTERMFRTNVLGTIYLTRLFGRQMVENGTGHVVNIASMAGKISTPKSAVYAATKAAVIAYDDALRLEVRRAGVHVTTVNPGPVATNFFKNADAEDYESKIAMFALSPDKLAERIVAAFGRNVREINLPRIMSFGAKVYPIFPRVGDYLTGTIFNRK